MNKFVNVKTFRNDIQALLKARGNAILTDTDESYYNSGYKDALRNVLQHLGIHEKSQEDIAIEYIINEKGFPITTNGYIPSYEELFNDIKAGIEHAQKEGEKSVNLEKELESYLATFDGAVLPSALELAKHFFNIGRKVKKSDYDPYETTVRGILKMFESYNELTTDKADFINNIRVKCKDAVNYEEEFSK